MAAPNFFIVAGNTAPSYAITCQRDGEDLDLTDATSVVVIIQQKSTGDVTQSGKAATITAASTGDITYTASSTDFPEAGRYVGDIRVTYSGGGVEVLYRQATWKVRDPIS